MEHSHNKDSRLTSLNNYHCRFWVSSPTPGNQVRDDSQKPPPPRLAYCLTPRLPNHVSLIK